ncbi:hypothetical protein CPC08DRAFT_346871 [Agrocybe pediades]|nr:hypothetical protein CPC08DRAFT_346871 [Agrocybe pediades]
MFAGLTAPSVKPNDHTQFHAELARMKECYCYPSDLIMTLTPGAASRTSTSSSSPSTHAMHIADPDFCINWWQESDQESMTVLSVTKLGSFALSERKMR